MADYKRMYLNLFSSIGIAVDALNAAARLLQKAQQDAEALFMDGDDAPICLAGEGGGR